MADIPGVAALPDYLASLEKMRWRLGSMDCCTLMADWLVSLGLCDPMADRRGSYSTHTEYRRLIRSEGGLLASCSARFSSIGLVETMSPKMGDVALVLVPFAVRRNGRPACCAVGSVCVSETERAMTATNVALAIREIPTLKAWTIARR